MSSLGKHWVLSEEAKRKIGDSKRGKKFPKISAAAKERLKDKTKNPMFGKSFPEESKQILRDKAIQPYRIEIAIQNLPKYKKGEGPCLGKHLSAETKHKISQSRLGTHLSEETIRKIILANTGGKRSLETRKKMSDSAKAIDHYWFTPELFKKAGMANRGKKFTESHRLNLANSRKRWFINESPESKRLRSKKAIEKWQSFSVEKQNDLIRNVMLKNKLTPNKLELDLLKIINEACPNQYKFTGDGNIKEAITGGMCPDFWNSDHKFIEFFGDYWHKGENPQDKIDKYAKVGYDCLVLWEHEVTGNSKEKLIETIRAFNKKTQRTSPWALPLGIRQAKPD